MVNVRGHDHKAEGLAFDAQRVLGQEPGPSLLPLVPVPASGRAFAWLLTYEALYLVSVAIAVAAGIPVQGIATCSPAWTLRPQRHGEPSM